MSDAVAVDRADAPMVSLLKVRPHHLRSIQIERDFHDPRSTAHYLVTPFVEGVFARLAQSLMARSTTRSWRLTGDYGSGKSSLALAFARLAAGERDKLPEALCSVGTEVRLEPVLVVGERGSLSRSLGKALHSTARRVFGRVPRDLKRILKEPEAFDAAHAVEATEAVAEAVRSSGRADGILLVLDELGRNLEHAASTPERSDVHLLQDLAESAVRSGTTPIVVLAILHQAVTAYARDLSSVDRREWEKVSGRFEEIVFAPPVEQAALLASAALGVDRRHLPATIAAEAAACMDAAVRVGWYGPGAPRSELVELAPALVPLDPLVLPILTRILRRFGQNERSLFSFLSSSEPHGLLEHARLALDRIRPYRLHDLYDYVSANLAGALASGSAGTRWGVIDSVVRSAAVRDDLERELLKAVGIVNLLDDPSFPLTTDLLRLAAAGSDPSDQSAAGGMIARLIDRARVLYDRGAGGGLCLWPNTSVDLEDAFEKALHAVGPDGDLVEAVGSVLPPEPLVARRHYVKTGTLRHFRLLHCSGPELAAVLSQTWDPAVDDGRIVLVLSSTERERTRVLDHLKTFTGWTDTLIVGVPEPVGGLAPLLRDLRAWRWVAGNTLALAGDRLARDEVSRQTAAAEDRLRRSLGLLLDLRGGGALTTRWLHRGEPLAIRTARQFSEKLSDICDHAYRFAPIVRNELINRRTLSSAAVKARSRLIEGLAQEPDAPFLGLDPAHTPPEMAIYLSVVRAGGVHVENGGRWCVVEPDVDHLRLRPSLAIIAEALSREEDRRVPYEELARELREPPYGVRDGLIPLLLAIYIAVNWHRTAVYEEGTYLEQVGGPEFTRMLKEPEHFAIQHCAVEGVRAEVFARLAAAIDVPARASRPELLDVVRPLLKYVAKLPDHARRTQNLSVTAAAVRSVLLRVSDPSSLVFTDLPKACGLAPFSNGRRLDAGSLDAFVSTMARVVRELANAYPALLDRMAQALRQTMEADEGTLEGLQAVLARRVERHAATIVEPELKAFALRLCDQGLPAKPWLEAVASFLARKPPERWSDADEREFHHRLKILGRRFRRVLATADDPSTDLQAGPGQVAFRVVVTAGDGRELEELVHGRTADEQVRELEAQFSKLLADGGRPGLLALARALVAMPTDDRAIESHEAE